MSEMITTLRKFANHDPNIQVHWCVNGTHKENLYYKVLVPETYAQAALNNTCILGSLVPSPIETVLASSVVEQKIEESYYHEGNHPNEPSTRNRPRRQVGKHRPKRSNRRKNWGRNKAPEETDPYYFKHPTYEEFVDYHEHDNYQHNPYYHEYDDYQHNINYPLDHDYQSGYDYSSDSVYSSDHDYPEYSSDYESDCSNGYFRYQYRLGRRPY